MPAATGGRTVIKQKVIIAMLQEYLKAQGIDIVVNKTGICNGLAAVYCKYVAEEKEAEFLQNLQLLNKIGTEISVLKKSGSGQVSMPTTPDIQNSLNKFVSEVLLAFSPEQFNKQLSQVDAVDLLKIEIPGKKEKQSLNKRYSIGLTTTDEEWAKVFSGLKIEGGVMMVANPDHAIAVTFKDNKFHVYDPNGNKIQACPNEEVLVRGLRKHVFNKKLDPELSAEVQHAENTLLPLTVSVYTHPNNTIEHSFPDIDAVLTPTSIFSSIEKYNSFAMASGLDNTDEIRALFSKGAKDPEMGLLLAVRDNRLKSLEVFLEPSYREKFNQKDVVMPYACEAALSNGRTSVFQRLIQDEEINNFFKAKLVDRKNQEDVFQKVAQSGNAESINQYINYLKTNVSPDIDIKSLIESSGALKKAEESGRRACVNILKQELGISPDPSPQVTLQSNSNTGIIAGLCAFTEYLVNLVSKLFSSKAEPVCPVIKGRQDNIRSGLQELRADENQPSAGIIPTP